MEVRNITKAATFKSFLYLSYKKHTVTFSVAVIFNIFRRQTLIDDFCGLHKNMNSAFPLIYAVKFDFENPAIMEDKQSVERVTKLMSSLKINRFMF